MCGEIMRDKYSQLTTIEYELIENEYSCLRYAKIEVKFHSLTLQCHFNLFVSYMR